MTYVELFNNDCLAQFKNIPEKSIDLVLTDPPYGTTACRWDVIIPFADMWSEEPANGARQERMSQTFNNCPTRVLYNNGMKHWNLFRNMENLE